MTILVETEDRHFAWMLGGPAESADLRLPPDGIGEPRVLVLLRGVAADLRAVQVHGSWMIVTAGEVIGLCGYKAPPDAARVVEIGYGIVPSRRGSGHGTRAVAALIEAVSRDASVRSLIAETAIANIASQIVLMRNAFESIGRRADPEAGELIVWRRDIAPVSCLEGRN